MLPALLGTLLSELNYHKCWRLSQTKVASVLKVHSKAQKKTVP